jgi:hypothetical protein
MTTPEAPVDHGSERLRRDEPTRTEPNRGTAHLLLPSAGETVDAGVKIAYKVCDEYVRRGQEAAQKQGAQNGERQNPWVFPGVPLTGGVTAIPLQLFRTWALLAGSFADMTKIPGAAESVRATSKVVEEFWAMLGVSGEDPAAKPEAKPTATSSPSAIRVAVEIASAQPVEVEIDFDPPSGVVPMIQRLSPLRGQADPLSALEFTFDPASDRAKLSLAIPPAQAPGRYTGTIFDDRDDRVCGSVRVRVGD